MIVRTPASTPPRIARALRSLTVVALCLFGLLITGSAAAEPRLGDSAARQIAQLLAEKQSRSPGQQKIDSGLLLELRSRRGDAETIGLPPLRRSFAIDPSGRVLVDVSATVTPRLLGRIEALEGTVVSRFAAFDAVRAHLPLAALEALADLAEVRSIRPADRMMRQVTTEGDVAHRADVARSNFGVDGSGVKTCAMSDSIDALADLQALGELPPVVDVLPGQSGNPGTSEGTALLEIIHDMAPGSDLGFATGVGGQAQMAQNILDLESVLDCDVIVDDVLYFAEPVFQDGVIAQAVDTVAANGAIYFSAAGNSGNLNDGESGVWEGDYVDTALPPPLVGFGVAAHDFGGGSNSNLITADSPFFFTLQWADPQGASGNDYDLFLLNGGLTTILGASTTTQNGNDDPFEAIDTTAVDDTGNRLVVVKFDADDRFFHMNTHRGRLDVGTDGQIFGHPAAVSAFAVAAVNVATAGGGPFTGGPANPVEPFSSDGFRRIFFGPAAAPLGIPEIREKPDVAAADGVSTATPGFETFFGTSASAPHAAAIAALFLEIDPDRTTAQFRDFFNSTALDIEDPGFDRDSGAGILDAQNLLQHQEIFADGFESGDTSAWTTQVP